MIEKVVRTLTPQFDRIVMTFKELKDPEKMKVD